MSLIILFIKFLVVSLNILGLQALYTLIFNLNSLIIYIILNKISDLAYTSNDLYISNQVNSRPIYLILDFSVISLLPKSLLFS